MTATLSKQTEQQLFHKMEESNTSNGEHHDNLDHLENEFNESQKNNQQQKQPLDDKSTQKTENKKAAFSLNFIEEDEYQDRLEDSSKYVRTLQELEHDREAEDRRSAKKKSYKSVAPVNSDQLHPVRALLRFKLALFKISFEKLAKEYIFTPKIESKGTISIMELIQVFSSDPLSLEETDCENLARFLVEDNLQDVIKLRMTMEADNQLVRSRLRFLLGKIRVFTAEEETVLNNQLAAIQTRFGDGIYAQLQLNNDVRISLQATKDQVMNALAYNDIDLTRDQADYFFLRLFERTHNYNKFNLDDCCKLFLSLQK